MSAIAILWMASLALSTTQVMGGQEEKQMCDQVFVNGYQQIQPLAGQSASLVVDHESLKMVKSMSTKLRCLNVFLPQMLQRNVSVLLKQMRNKATLHVSRNNLNMKLECPAEWFMVKKGTLKHQHCWYGPMRIAFVNLYVNVVLRGDGKAVGIDVDVWELLAKKYNLKFHTINAQTNNNMIRMLAMGKADVGIGQSAFVIQRHQVADESVYIARWRLGFMTRKAMPIDKIYTLVYPFDSLVWWALMGSFASVTLASLVMLRVGQRYLGLFPLLQLQFSIFGIEGMPSVAHDFCRSLRNMRYLPVWTIWLLSGALLSLSYQSTLLASLVNVQKDNPIDTWKELLNSDTNIYVLKNSIFGHLMKNSRDPVVREIHSKKAVEANPEEQITERFDEDIASGKWTSVTVTAAMYGHRHYAILSRDSLSSGFSGYYYSFQTPLKEAFDSDVLWLHQCGVVKKITEKWLWGLEEKERIFYRKEKTRREGIPLSFRHFYALWIIVGVGTAASLVAVLAELGSNIRGQFKG